MTTICNSKGRFCRISMKSYKYGTLTDDISDSYIRSLGLTPDPDEPDHYHYHDLMRLVSLCELWRLAGPDRHIYLEWGDISH